MSCGTESSATSGSRRPSVVVGMLGARDHYAIPRILHEAGMLDTLFTDLYLSPATGAGRLLASLPVSLRPRAVDRLLGRFEASLPPERVRTFPSEGLRFWLAYRFATDTVRRTLTTSAAMARLNRRIVAVGFPTAEAVVGYRGGSVELFEYGKDRGIFCILNQSGVARKRELELLQEEESRWPGWEPGLRTSPEDVVHEREGREWGLADRILVASTFTRDAIDSSGGPIDRCRVVPLGVDLNVFTPGPQRAPKRDRLRVLFAGQVRLQKGIPYLLEALRCLNSRRVEVKIAGHVQLHREKLQSYEKYAQFLGAVPRARMIDLFHWADLFVFPSVCDGFGLAVYEAMACGVPVVITDGAGAEIRHGVDGLVVAARDANGLARAIEKFLEHPDLRMACRAATLVDRDRLGMARYAQRLVHAVTDGIVPR